MQETSDENTVSLLTVEHYMPAKLHPPQSGTNIIARAAQSGMVCQALTTCLKLAEVMIGLGLTPGPKRILADA